MFLSIDGSWQIVGGFFQDRDEVKQLFAEKKIAMDDGYFMSLWDVIDTDQSGDIDRTEFEALYRFEQLARKKRRRPCDPLFCVLCSLVVAIALMLLLSLISATKTCDETDVAAESSAASAAQRQTDNFLFDQPNLRFDLTPLGSESVIGRSIVIHSPDGLPLACSNLVADAADGRPDTPAAVAVFADGAPGSNGLSGRVVITEARIIVAQFAGLPPGASYPWHIHSDPVPPSGDCAGTGGHFDPTGLGQSPNAVGELSARHGDLLPTASTGRRRHLQTNASSTLESDTPWAARCGILPPPAPFPLQQAECGEGDTQHFCLHGGSCMSVPEKTCSSSGDPHFISFDGYVRAIFGYAVSPHSAADHSRASAARSSTSWASASTGSSARRSSRFR